MDKKFLAAHYDRFCCTNVELIHGEIRGIIRGDINATIESKQPVLKDPAMAPQKTIAQKGEKDE